MKKSTFHIFFLIGFALFLAHPVSGKEREATSEFVGGFQASDYSLTGAGINYESRLDFLKTSPTSDIEYCDGFRCTQFAEALMHYGKNYGGMKPGEDIFQLEVKYSHNATGFADNAKSVVYGVFSFDGLDWERRLPTLPAGHYQQGHQMNVAKMSDDGETATYAIIEPQLSGSERDDGQKRGGVIFEWEQASNKPPKVSAGGAKALKGLLGDSAERVIQMNVESSMANGNGEAPITQSEHRELWFLKPPSATAEGARAAEAIAEAERARELAQRSNMTCDGDGSFADCGDSFVEGAYAEDENLHSLRDRLHSVHDSWSTFVSTTNPAEFEGARQNILNNLDSVEFNTPEAQERWKKLRENVENVGKWREEDLESNQYSESSSLYDIRASGEVPGTTPIDGTEPVSNPEVLAESLMSDVATAIERPISAVAPVVDTGASKHQMDSRSEASRASNNNSNRSNLRDPLVNE